MRKLTSGILTMIMVLAIAGAASAHKDWAAITSQELQIVDGGWMFLTHTDGEDKLNVRVVMKNGGLALTDVHQYTAYFAKIEDKLTPNKVSPDFADDAFKSLNFTSGNYIAVTVFYVNVNGRSVPVQLVDMNSEVWAREI